MDTKIAKTVAAALSAYLQSPATEAATEAATVDDAAAATTPAARWMAVETDGQFSTSIHEAPYDIAGAAWVEIPADGIVTAAMVIDAFVTPEPVDVAVAEEAKADEETRKADEAAVEVAAVAVAVADEPDPRKKR